MLLYLCEAVDLDSLSYCTYVTPEMVVSELLALDHENIACERYLFFVSHLYSQLLQLEHVHRSVSCQEKYPIGQFLRGYFLRSNFEILSLL